jgi:hypothetical protein
MRNSRKTQVITLQVTELSLGQALGLCFTIAQLHCHVTFLVLAADLRDMAWSSFDDGHRNNIPLLVKNLGHTHLLTNYALHILASRGVLRGLRRDHMFE